MNLMDEANKRKINCLILSIDFKKAFDSIEHSFINSCLTLLNFGDDFKKWVQLFFQNRETYLLLDGPCSPSGVHFHHEHHVVPWDLSRGQKVKGHILKERSARPSRTLEPTRPARMGLHSAAPTILTFPYRDIYTTKSEQTVLKALEKQYYTKKISSKIF